MASVEILADHTLLLALPAFAPAVVVVGVVVWVAMRDRRNPAEDDEEDQDDQAAAAANDAAAKDAAAKDAAAKDDGTP